MTHSIFSRSGKSVHGTSGRGVHEIVRVLPCDGHRSQQNCRQISLAEGSIPFLGGRNSLGAVLQHWEVLQVPIQYLDSRYILTYGLSLIHI